MSTSKHINKLCIAAVAVTLVITILFMCGESIGLTLASKAAKYESTLFDTSYVHKIDIVMNDWDSFIESCENEEYASCTVVVDGNKYSNIAIRAKGNTSLSSVKSMGSQRYSFKLEFDHFEEAKTIDGLDKLCLNNLIQDNTMMKDYIAYTLMNDFGADSPLCSFAYLTVNGEDWGLYLAVESIEDSFLSRNYGSDAGDLYKPDSMSFGGGRGNGKDFNPDDFDFSGESDDDEESTAAQNAENTGESASSSRGGNGFPSGDFTPPGDFSSGDFTPPEGFEMPDNFDGGFPGQSGEGSDGADETADEETSASADSKKSGKMSFGGMGSDDVKLKYIDDDIDSYSNIFDNAKTKVSKADKKRLINSLKKLSSYTDLEEVLDTDEVMRYFVVHNFLCNGDSYTGMMIHNYYLHESDGKLSMIPWDYNLAFGTFRGNNAASTVNTSIDSPISMGNVDDRPMLGWIFSDESYTQQYHELFSEFIEKWFTNGELEQLIADTAEMIRPYVEKDPTKFCTTEEFDSGVEALSEFVSLRAEAVRRQLGGDDTAVETGDLNLTDMGSMGGGMGKGFGGFSGGGIMSMITLKDKDGNEVKIDDVIKDTSSIKKLTLSDGSEIDVSSTDMQAMKELMQTDFSKVVSVTDKDGNVTDLSAYTISMSMPSTGGRSRSGSSEDGSGNSFRMPGGQMPGGGQDFNGAPPSWNTKSGESTESADSSESGETQDGKGQEEASSRENFTPPGGMPSAPGESNSSDTQKTFYVLTGVSVLVLAIGIFIAAKKKY